MLTESRQAPAGTGSAHPRQEGAGRRTTALYVVCSPKRGVGKTLLARLLAEFYLIDGRPVAAFDLADEGPQLADYLPDCTTIADIGDATGQMALFDRILADRQATKIIDLSHRTFKDFFTIAEKIGFFAEARRQGIEPLILFMIDPGQKSAKAYAILRRWLMEASLLPVRNQMVAKGIPYCAAFPNESAVPVSLGDAGARRLAAHAGRPGELLVRPFLAHHPGLAAGAAGRRAAGMDQAQLSPVPGDRALADVRGDIVLVEMTGRDFRAGDRWRQNQSAAAPVRIRLSRILLRLARECLAALTVAQCVHG